METAEYKMAIIDAGHVLATDDPAINKFQTLLTKIQEVYPGMEPKQYSSGAVAAKNELAKMGISVSLMEIMQAVSEVPKVSAKDDFPGAVTAYATLRSQGATHDEAVKGMQQVAKAVRRNQRQ